MGDDVEISAKVLDFGVRQIAHYVFDGEWVQFQHLAQYHVGALVMPVGKYPGHAVGLCEHRAQCLDGSAFDYAYPRTRLVHVQSDWHCGQCRRTRVFPYLPVTTGVRSP